MPDLTPSAITNIESGRKQQGVRRRHITVDELLVLSVALKVPALLLITPIGEDRDLELIPGEAADPWDAYMICAGTSPQISPDYTSVDANFRGKIATYMQHDDAARRWMLMKDSERAAPWLETVVAKRAEIRAKGWRLPRLPPAGWNTAERGEELLKLVETTEIEQGVMPHPSTESR